MQISDEEVLHIAKLARIRLSDNEIQDYKKNLEESEHPLKDDIVKYTKGARCTFPDFTCTSDCNFKQGKTLERKI